LLEIGRCLTIRQRVWPSAAALVQGERRPDAVVQVVDRVVVAEVHHGLATGERLDRGSMVWQGSGIRATTIYAFP
jgi:hypothetical protein